MTCSRGTPAPIPTALSSRLRRCLSKLIDSIQDHYTFAQPGIQRMVFKLKELIARIDAPLHAHLQEQGVHFIQCALATTPAPHSPLHAPPPKQAHVGPAVVDVHRFAFRWMNCLLMRELSLDLILRVWDTYLAEHSGSDDASFSDATSDGFAVLHVYACAALLTRYSAELLKMDFGELVMFLQHLPTTGWSVKEVSEHLRTSPFTSPHSAPCTPLPSHPLQLGEGCRANSFADARLAADRSVHRLTSYRTSCSRPYIVSLHVDRSASCFRRRSSSRRSTITRHHTSLPTAERASATRPHRSEAGAGSRAERRAITRSTTTSAASPSLRRRRLWGPR